jgi:hypothetical protein
MVLHLPELLKKFPENARLSLSVTYVPVVFVVTLYDGCCSVLPLVSLFFI